MLNLRWSWHAPTARLFASIDPAAWAAADGDPIAMLSALPPERIAALAADAGVPRPAGRGRAGPARVHVGPALVRRGRPGPVRTGRGRLLLARVRHHRRAAAVLRRPGHPGRRPPQVGQRPRRAADRGRAAVPARLLHPVAVRRRLAGRALPGDDPNGLPLELLRDASRRRRCTSPSACPRAASWPPRSGWRRWAGSRCCCSTPTSRRTSRTCTRSPTGCTAAAASTGCARSCCSASAGCGRSGRSAR